MPLNRSYFRGIYRLYPRMYEFVTLRHRNSDGTMLDAIEVQWRATWDVIDETIESTANEAITTTRRQWWLWRWLQPRIPNTGDQIIDQRGNVWEMIGPVGHKMREQVYFCDCIQADLIGKTGSEGI